MEVRPHILLGESGSRASDFDLCHLADTSRDHYADHTDGDGVMLAVALPLVQDGIDRNLPHKVQFPFRYLH
jgi:hypothetical protein